jgi:hypothetical protein
MPPQNVKNSRKSLLARRSDKQDLGRPRSPEIGGGV